MNIGGVYGFTFLPLFPISCESGVPVALSCVVYYLRAQAAGYCKRVCPYIYIYIYVCVKKKL